MIKPGNLITVKPSSIRGDPTYPKGFEGKIGIVGKVKIEMGETLLLIRINNKMHEFFIDEVELFTETLFPDN